MTHEMTASSTTTKQSIENGIFETGFGYMLIQMYDAMLKNSALDSNSAELILLNSNVCDLFRDRMMRSLAKAVATRNSSQGDDPATTG
jgi:hypothetical protein